MVNSEMFEQVKPGTTIIKRSIKLPLKAEKGEWQFCIEYETEVQPTINVCKAFEVDDDPSTSKIRIYIRIIEICSALILCVLVLIAFFGRKKIKQIVNKVI